MGDMILLLLLLLLQAVQGVVLMILVYVSTLKEKKGDFILQIKIEFETEYLVQNQF